MLPELAIIVPTLNEAGNVAELYRRLNACLAGVNYEIVFVDDDSTDDTRKIIRELAVTDPCVRLIHRTNRRGLSSACIEGMQASFAPFCAVMDADLQHDESLLPQMLKHLRAGEADIVVASRFAGENLEVAEKALTPARQLLSKVGNSLARRVMKARLTDPLSGFFMLRRNVLEEALPRLSGKGFKILVDIFASSPRPPRFIELPFSFRARHSGTSKLDPMVMSEYLFLLADKSLGRVLPIRFVLFVMVGLVGVLVHLAVLALMHTILGLSFETGQVVAILVAMTGNFLGNNWFTYRDRRLKGRAFWLGLVSFYLVCGLGAIINYQIAELLYAARMPWLFAGFVGAVIGAVWNYGATATFTWRPKR